jgi:hypothetical protein
MHPISTEPWLNAFPEVFREEGFAGADIADMLSAAGTYEFAYKAAGDRDMVFRVVDGNRVEFRYPPVPPISGFNVFGTLSRLLLNDVSGDLGSGLQSFRIAGPSTLEFRDIQALEVAGSVPIQFEFGRQHDQLVLRTAAKAFIDNQYFNPVLERRKQLVQLSSGLITIVSAILSFVIWLSIRKGNSKKPVSA